MKILCLSNVGSGLKIFRGELLEEFLARGDQVYAAFPEDEYRIPLEQMGCTVIDTPFERRGMNPIKDLKLLYTYWKLLAEVRPDAVLTYTVKPNVYGGLACRLKKIPYFSNVTGLGTSIQNPGPLQTISLTLYRIGLKKADCVFFQNSYNKAFMEKKGVCGRAARLLPGSGVNLSQHACYPYPQDDGHIRFLFVGRIMRDKGIEELLQCASVVHQRNSSAEFFLVGGYDEPQYMEQIQALEKAGILRYLGWRPDVQDLMKQAHCIIHPSYHEGLSNVLLEAAACGRPVIASNVPGCQETFDDGITGLGCTAKSADSLIAAVERFLALSYEQKAAMGRAGREKVEREFDRNLVVNAYMEELEKVHHKKR